MDIDDAELEKEETWEFERAEKHEGRKSRRAVVSVAFARDDFQAVAQAARQRGTTTSEFIRRAALEKLHPATGSGSITVSISSGGTGLPRLYEDVPAAVTLPPTIPQMVRNMIVAAAGVVTETSPAALEPV